MELTGERTIEASREKVFAALNDPDVLKASIPGCQSLEKTSDTSFDAVVGLRVGPVTAKFNGSVTLEDLKPPESYSIVGEGKGGAAGFAKGRADIVLDQVDEGTLLKYTVKADLGGKIAQLGGRLMQSTANKLSGEFFDTFAEQVAADAASTVEVSGPAASPVAAIETPERPSEVANQSAPDTASGSGMKNWMLAIAAGIAVVILIWLIAR